MKDIEARVGELLRNRPRVEALLRQEKARRGVPEGALVFVGTANVARSWWCAEQAVLKSRAIELDVFSAYLQDRIEYAHRLGLLRRWPRSDSALLKVGDEITPDEIEKLLKENAREAEELGRRPADTRPTWISEDRLDRQGIRTRLINPDLPPEERQWQEEVARMEGIRVIGLEDDPKQRGEIYEASRAEKYPRIWWHFPWGRYSIGGVPDGLAGDFVYEYKTTRRLYYLRNMQPIAFTQADLYGHFFRRTTKRVQIHVLEQDKTFTWEVPVDAANAEAALSLFARVDAGELPEPPEAWKCRVCDFRMTCPISQAK
jgi:hypothetical protein